MAIVLNKNQQWLVEALAEYALLTTQQISALLGVPEGIGSAWVLLSGFYEDLPVVIEIVDSEEQINTLSPFIDEAVQEGLVTLEPVRVIKWRASGSTA